MPDDHDGPATTSTYSGAGEASRRHGRPLKAGASRIVISVNSSWNILNFRAGLVASLHAAGHEVVALAPPDEYTPQLTAMGCRFAPIAIDAKGTNPVRDAALLATYVRRLI